MLRQYRTHGGGSSTPPTTVVSRNKNVIISAGLSTPEIVDKKNHWSSGRVNIKLIAE